MFPDIDLDDAITNKEKVETEKVGKTFLFDFKEGDFVMKDGKLVEVEGKEGLKIWIEKTIRTDKFKFNVYKEESEEGIRTDEYGVSIRNLILGRKYPDVFVKSEIKRELTEEITKHPLVENLTDWEIDQVDTTLRVNFTVIMTDGESFSQEVMV